ncbi:MAG: hypothetical protein JKX68_04950, partial [Flavobacteriales bacterium]|nr:hypothetical protein [Flavobacteriales bacterium]
MLNKFKFYILLLTLAIFSSNSIFSQGGTCNTADPFCTGTTATFPGGINQQDASIQEPGNDYGCLGTSPNPAWYYMEIDQSGNLIIDMTNSAGVDIDFALWGPFNNLAAAMGNCGALGSPADCSYSTSANETATITGANTGDVCILLVTNFANVNTNISFTDNSSSTATTNCAIINPCIINSLSTNPSACNPANNLYDVSGSITFVDPPISGTLTLTDCHGNSQVFNAPFASPINYNITGINSDGSACNVTAVFSADPACTFSTNYNAPAACTVVPCAFTSLSVSVGACNANSTYDITGTLNFNNPPATGTLTITNVCSGNDTIINAPFVSPFNWSISGLPTGTGTCDVVAV